MMRVPSDKGVWNEVDDKQSVWIGKTSIRDINEMCTYLEEYKIYGDLYEKSDDPKEDEDLYNKRCKYEKFHEDGMINIAIGEDFLISYVDTDYTVVDLLKVSTNDTKKLFKELDLVEEVTEMLGQKLDDEYNVAISLGKLDYSGNIKEIYNEKYGYFKFIGVFPW